MWNKILTLLLLTLMWAFFLVGNLHAQGSLSQQEVSAKKAEKAKKDGRVKVKDSYSHFNESLTLFYLQTQDIEIHKNMNFSVTADDGVGGKFDITF